MGNLLRLFSALSDKNRLRIIAALKEYGDMCACHIVELLQVSGATTSWHLAILLQVGLIDSYKEGRWVHYLLNRSNKNFNEVMVWLEEQLIHADVVREDAIVLEKIMSVDRKIICSRQRAGKECSPSS